MVPRRHDSSSNRAWLQAYESRLATLRIPFRSLRRDAAVDHQHLARDVAGVAPEQELHRLADVPAGGLDPERRGLRAGCERAARVAR